MKADDLAKELLKHPDFEVEFRFTDGYGCGADNCFPNIWV